MDDFDKTDESVMRNIPSSSNQSPQRINTSQKSKWDIDYKSCGGVPDREHPFEDGDVDDATRPRLQAHQLESAVQASQKERGVRRREAGEEDPREETLGDGGGAQDAGQQRAGNQRLRREREPSSGVIDQVAAGQGPAAAKKPLVMLSNPTKSRR